MSKEKEEQQYIDYFKKKEQKLEKIDYLILKIEKIEKLLNNFFKCNK